MDGMEFTLSCVQLGLNVSRSNFLRDGKYEYGMIKKNHFQTMGDEVVQLPLAGIKEISYIDKDHRLILRYEDHDEVIYGTVFSKEDAASMVRMSMMPTCLMELNAVMDLLFPEIGEKLYFDVLNEQMAFYPSLFNPSIEEEDEKPVMFSDEHVPTYILQIQTRLRDEGFTGRRYPSKDVCIDTLKYRALKNPRNLFREWLESLTWDGKPRLRRWFIDGLGATAPPLEDTEHADIYLESATEAWFLGTVRRQYEPTKVEVVPVLIGGEGVGKGNFLRYTAGYNDAWFIDTSASLEGPGAEQKFLESIRGRVIVELSESSQFMSVKGAELLKAFVSKTEDQGRKAYATFQTTSVRRFTLIATSNMNNIFYDTGGGNRRYFPMYCNPNRAILPFDPKYRQIGRYEMEQAWAEAHFMYMNDPHANAYISKEVAELAAIMQEYGTRDNPAVSIIDDWLNDPRNGYTELGSRIDKAFIFNNILHVDLSGIIPKSAEYAYTTWTNIQKCWKKKPKSSRIDGRVSSTVFVRVFTPEEIMEKKRSNMVNVRPEDIKNFIDLVGIMRTRAFKYGFSKPGDNFPIDGLTTREIQALITAGYIYEDSLDKYCVITMP